MPIPLLVPIGLGVVAVATALGFGIPLVLKRFGEKADGKTITILGRQEVGKSTLLHFLSKGKIPDRRTLTPDPLPGETFTLDIQGKGEVLFTVPKDLPGHTEPAYKDWKNGFQSSDYVWYLFRSDLIAAGDPAEVKLVKEHLDHLVDWYVDLREKKSATPKVILVGVFADLDPSYSDNGAFENTVKATEVVKQNAVKLGKADIVIGSQVSIGAAEKLVERITRYLE